MQDYISCVKALEQHKKEHKKIMLQNWFEHDETAYIDKLIALCLEPNDLKTKILSEIEEGLNNKLLSNSLKSLLREMKREIPRFPDTETIKSSFNLSALNSPD